MALVFPSVDYWPRSIATLRTLTTSGGENKSYGGGGEAGGRRRDVVPKIEGGWWARWEGGCVLARGMFHGGLCAVWRWGSSESTPLLYASLPPARAAPEALLLVSCWCVTGRSGTAVDVKTATATRVWVIMCLSTAANGHFVAETLLFVCGGSRRGLCFRPLDWEEESAWRRQCKVDRLA